MRTNSLKLFADYEREKKAKAEQIVEEKYGLSHAVR